MADKNFTLEIMTPMKSVFKGEITSLIANGADGQFGVLIDHAPMLAALDFGPLFVKTTDGQSKWFVVSSGFFEILHNKASLLVETCEAKEDIDMNRAKAAKERAEQRLNQHDGIDILRAQMALQRALMRLKTAMK
ncbi:MAG: F0F1 ATP synthase subunit epsilon [bacterium]